MTSKSLKEKKDILNVLVLPQEITSKRGKMNWLLESLGKNYNKLSCAKALEKLNIPDNHRNRKYWYDRKSEFVQALKKSERGLKYERPEVSYHHFNEASVFLERKFALLVRSEAVSQGWQTTDARNRFILWRAKDGSWCKWFETGRVRLHVRKPVTDGKIMQLLADAFFNTELITDIKVFTAFFRSFFLKSVKLDAFLGKKAKIPKFQIEFENGYCKLVVSNDGSHPKSIHIQYYLLKEGEMLRQYLKDSEKSLNYSAEVNIKLTETLQKFVVPNGAGKPNGVSDPSYIG